MIFLGEQPELIDAGRADLIDDGHDVAILGASIALDVNGLVQTGGDAILDQTGEMGVTTMKMISSTSMMSAMGITLGDAIWGPATGL